MKGMILGAIGVALTALGLFITLGNGPGWILTIIGLAFAVWSFFVKSNRSNSNE